MAGSAGYAPMQAIVGGPKRSHGWNPLVIWVLVGLAVVAVGLGVGYYFMVRSLGEGLGRAFSGFSRIPAALDASEADQAARAHLEPDAALTPQVLNDWKVGSSTMWVSGDVSVPSNGRATT